MKILVVVPDSNIGGITSAVVNFCNELSRKGQMVTLLDMSGDYFCAEQLHDNVSLGCLEGKSKYWNLRAENLKRFKGFKKIKIAFLGALKKLTIKSGFWFKLIFSKYKQFGAFDVAVAFRQCDSCYSFVLHKVNAKKKIGFVHGELTYMGDIRSWRKYMPKFDKIAYVSNAVKDQFVQAYPYLKKNACTIYNMIDVKFITKLASQENPFLFDKDIINIVTISRLTVAKQVGWIPKICKNLKTIQNVKFHWYIIGNGYYNDFLNNTMDELNVRDVLTLCGESNNPYAILKDADFSVLLSKSEAFGLVVIESFILGVPVVVAKYPSLQEIMVNDKYGFVVEQNIEAATLKILEMINDTETRNKMREELNGFQQDNSMAYAQFLEAVK